MNGNPYYYKPYDKSNKYINKSNKNHNFTPNNHGKFYSSYHNQRNHFNNNNNNKGFFAREREEYCEMHTERNWKRKGNNNNWMKIPKPVQTSTAVKRDDTCQLLSPKWCKEDAMKAIEIENAFNHLQSNQYVLRFPDPFIDKSIIQGYSSAIVDVRVQQPITPR